jgi:hypothetical protein
MVLLGDDTVEEDGLEENMGDEGTKGDGKD